MPTLNFTVDSALLKELGERLVGKPHIALAELVKNSYDADASVVTIEFAPASNRIEVRDDGHGMTFDEFRDFWMRVGTPHKAEKRVSKNLQRPMTGSKGIGRLAVQFLASSMRMVTVPKEYDGEWLEASVDWEKAVQAGDLVDASVSYSNETSPRPFEHGTSIVLSGLKQDWRKTDIENLAGELWWLQPPYHSVATLAPDGRFEIAFKSTQRELKEVFDREIGSILGIWMARLVGKNERGHVTISLEFAGETPKTYTCEIAGFHHNDGHFDEGSNLNDGDFEIRVFKLKYRQPHGIKVADARDYFWKYGGVHVYDGGFRLPYYGDIRNDWLQIEFEHAHRRFVSELLPKELQARYVETERLRYLPTLGRVFGVVNVDTSREPNLHIMITRDRLTDTVAFDDLRAMVRYAFHLYAFEEARRQFERTQRQAPIEPTSLKFENVEQVLEYYEPQIPDDVYHRLRSRIQEATSAATTSQEVALRQIGLLGPLATAGISALAYQHELRKQFAVVESLVERIREVATGDPALRQSLNSLGEDLSSWLKRARATNALFDYLADAENTRTRSRFRAVTVVEEVERQTAFLARGVEVNTSKVDGKLLLPEASLAEWGAIFQNVFTNAFNAMANSEERLLQVSSRVMDNCREILVQDTGRGVDLRDADRVFEPFERRIEIPQERRALGYGGTGLGLTIVRLLADKIGCRVGFVDPDQGFSTAFSLSWRETK